MWLYPLPCVVALAGWLFVYATTGRLFIAIGAGTLIAGFVVFLIWAKRVGSWPYVEQTNLKEGCQGCQGCHRFPDHPPGNLAH